MGNIKKNIINNQWSGVLSLGIGTIIGQSINVLSQPIITRLVSPADLGIYSLILSMANLVIPIASLKLYMLIVVEENDDAADEITNVSLITVFLISLFYSIFIGSLFLIRKNILSDIGLISFLIPIMVLTNGIRFIFISYNNRYKNYSLISKTEISREISKGLFQVTSGYFGFGALGLSLGYALSPLSSYRVLTNNYIKRAKKIDINSLLKIYKKNIKHMLYLVPAQFINTFSYTLITMSVISLFSATEAGYYSVSITVLGLPLVVISNNVSRVYLQKLSEDYRNGNSVWENYKSIISILTIISVIGFSFLAIIAPKVSDLIFGEGYQVAGEYIAILCTMYGLRFIASSIIGGYVVFNRQNMDLIFQIIMVAFGALVFVLTKALDLSVYQYLLLINITYGASYLLMIIYMGYICKRHSSFQE